MTDTDPLLVAGDILVPATHQLFVAPAKSGFGKFPAAGGGQAGKLPTIRFAGTRTPARWARHPFERKPTRVGGKKHVSRLSVSSPENSLAYSAFIENCSSSQSNAFRLSKERFCISQ
jgi:hypothetical protein